jgi:arsenate reductase
MQEAGIDISGHRSKALSEFLRRKIDTVITVCSEADAICPVFPGTVIRHHCGFDDPAKAEGSEKEILAKFREVRDRIRSVFEPYGVGRKHGALSRY